MTERIEAAEVVLPCGDLDASLRFYRDLGFRLEAIFPADDPAVAVVSGHGVRLRLQRGEERSTVVLRLACAEPAAIAGGEAVVAAPEGTRLELAPATSEVVVPPLQPSLVVVRDAEDDGWIVGRAGMRYRDLIPDRQGGRFVASHIRIVEGGPVPDAVHYHRVRFQIIYCLRGEVRVVYEDQGEPFVLQAGDCVLQPPGIRHRVLEASAGTEVLEVGCPASHETRLDHDLELPTARGDGHRSWSGQRFVRHQADAATWRPGWREGFEMRDTGVAAASGGVGSVMVLRWRGGEEGVEAGWVVHDDELLLGFVARGQVMLEWEGGRSERLAEGDAFVVPAGVRHRVRGGEGAGEIVEVRVVRGSVG